MLVAGEGARVPSTCGVIISCTTSVFFLICRFPCYILIINRIYLELEVDEFVVLCLIAEDDE